MVVSRKTLGRVGGGFLACVPVTPTLLLMTALSQRPAPDETVDQVAPVLPLLLALLSSVLLVGSSRRTRRAVSPKLFVPTIAYFLWLFLTALVSSPRLAPTVAISGAVLLVALTVGSGAKVYVFQGMRFGLRATLLLSLLTAILLPNWAWYGQAVAGSTDGVRLAGIYPQPNSLGAVAGALLLIEVLVSQGRRWPFVLSAAVALTLSGSMTALWACITAGVVVTLPVLKKLPDVRRSFVYLGAIALCGIAVSRSLSELGFGGRYGATTRDALWTFVAERWSDAPLIGHGPAEWGRLIDAGVLPSYAVHAHNQFLNTLFVHGLVGLLALGWFVVALGRETSARGAQAIVIYLLVRSLTEVPFELSFVGLSLVLIVLVPLAEAADRAGGIVRAPVADRRHGVHAT